MKSLVHFTLAVMFLVGCSGSGKQQETPAPEMPTETTHTLQEVFRVSEFEEENFYVNAGLRLTFLSDGNILLADRAFGGMKQILEINRNGELITTFGRKGKGPGEFLRIDRVVATPGDTLHVFDSQNARQQVFVKNSNEVWNVVRVNYFNDPSEEEFQVDFPVEVYPHDKRGYRALLINNVGIRDTTTKHYNFISEVDYNLNLLGPNRLVKPIQDLAVHREEGSMSWVSRSRFMKGYYFYRLDQNDVIYITNTSNRINIFDLNGSKEIAGYLPYEDRPVDSEVIEEDLKNRKTYDAERKNLLRSTYLDHEPYFWNIFLDGGWLWIHLFRHNAVPPGWAVTNIAGEIQATFNEPDNFTPVAIHDARIYALQYYEEVPYLVSYELTEK